MNLHKDLKEYIVTLSRWLPNGEREVFDETSVDAESPKEALETAHDVFLEAYPLADGETMGSMLDIVEVKEIPIEELVEICGL